MRGLRGWLRVLGGIAILVAIVVAVVLPQAAWNAAQLPLLALFSTTRMVLAYLLALVYAITALSLSSVSPASRQPVYSSLRSGSNGWVTLVRSETCSACGGRHPRPGRGSSIANAALVGATAGIAIGIGVLAAVVVALDT